MMKSVLKRLLLIPIYAYQYLISPLLPGACNFQPTCSEYSKLAIKQYGVIFGLYLSMKRVIKCNPWRGWEFDPVPKHKKKKIKKYDR